MPPERPSAEELDEHLAWESERALRKRLERIDEAMMVVTEALACIGGSDTLASVLQVIVDQARIVVDAEHGAFGATVVPGSETFTQWLYSGVDPAAAAFIGRAPRASGLLGEALRDKRPIRLDDVRLHAHFSGFPAHHPRITSLLSVPVRHGTKSLGNLFLGNKRGATSFSDDDQRSAEMLAARVGVAMEIARLNDAATAAVRSRDSLLAIVSHDLRNLLSVVSMKSDLLLRHRPDLERRQTWEHAEVIRSSIDRMGRLIQDLLQASTIESGSFTVEARTEDAAAVIDECVKAMAPTTEGNGIRLQRDVQAALPPVLCDRDRVLQVLSNLVGNAVKFTPAAGVIRLRVAAEGERVCFAVSDTGAGIPPDEMPRLFDRYWKGRSAGKRGTGLGLFIARGIIEAHGGKMWAESILGAGSTFFFTLPVSTAPLASVAAVQTPAVATRLHGFRVLVVDDEANAASALATLLGEEGLAVEAATSGLEALELAKNHRPDVVVLDVEMPGMNGLVLLDALRARLPGLPAVIMSGYVPDHAGIREALGTSAVAYVSKPIDLGRLLASLTELLAAPASPMALTGATV